ncbi:MULTISPECIES: GrpB family protein [unclassified Pseudomonas]|uniref:GrpB family protein n=1 Tax=unclassified Pseudomonas TaxID=196821 RepID=UPI000A0CB620|nr:MULTISPECIES: GrpB family protein [unclassified Pseudomonas]SME99784.1 GrpB domain, predicted nucleotidyltransferase, UPF0157 family [Pseudomonas sp. LAIL14HWK12:I11]SMR72139.1 GrpB domain, predicted nucleotidyltransferase, UPF0157 family [Pseudomonas sp. LAIL14HWK12:I10]SOD01076.1 GrpB domain, predicted nucleotidyltransferase, UPF0157 family [Pseudomonas sp. LAIL14HWK12:I8]
MNTVSIAEYSGSWKNQFSKEYSLIRSVVTATSGYVDHVGSTSVSHLSAKPIVDILISVGNWAEVDELISQLQSIGYRLSERCDSTPRFFLTKYTSDGTGSFHVHVCEPHSRWGRDMLVFKNELISDPQLAQDYANLKKHLAGVYHDDVQAYAAGKKNFIESRLKKVGGEFSINSLLTRQRAESNKSEKLQIAMMVVQFMIAVIAAFSVYLNNNSYLFGLAGLGFALMLLWVYFSQGQLSHRAAGDQARRAVLLMSGLKLELSAVQQLRISEGFKVSPPAGEFRREEDHFATREAPGYKRLAEMIEESSYWTRDLQTISCNFMVVALLLLVAVVLVVSGAAVASLASDSIVSLSRGVLAIMVFVVSSDALGLVFAYRSSAKTIDEIFKRVEAAAARSYKESDVLLLMADYNAAIERAPSTLPYLYKLNRDGLNRRWQAYVEAKLRRDIKTGSDTKRTTTPQDPVAP